MTDLPGGAPAPAPEPQFAVPARRSGRRRLLLLGLVIGAIAVCGVGMAVFVGLSYGPVPAAIGFAAAILPVPVIVLAFLWLDRYEPEPWKYLAFSFAWGACVATLVALGVNTGASYLFVKWGISDSLVAIFVAPAIEEGMKALGPVLLFWRRPRALSGITDGIVYCGLSATGFAMVENILYLGGIYVKGTEETGLASQGAVAVVALFVVRIGFTGFAHPLFTSITGIGLGVAARNRATAARWAAPLAGYLLAMMLHGTWNLLSVVSVFQPLVIVFGYVAVMLPILFTVVGVALWVRSWEGRVVARALPPYVRAAWLSPPELAALSTVGRRLAALYWARRNAGGTGYRAMRGYQHAAVRLALLRDEHDRGTPVAGFADQERALLHEIAGYRTAFTGRDPRVPRAVWDGSGYEVTFPDGSVRPVPAPATPVVPIPAPVTMLPRPPAYPYPYPPYR